MQARNTQLTAERARELFLYNRETGIVTRKIAVRGCKEGAIVGCVSVSGSGQPAWRVCVDGVFYMLHRVIWLMETGHWPEQIDHINHDPTDNRWDNLRDVNQQQNMMNVSIRCDNSSGVMGVSWRKDIQKWVSNIGKHDKCFRLYCGSDFFEACCRRKSAEAEFGFHKNHGR